MPKNKLNDQDVMSLMIETALTKEHQKQIVSYLEVEVYLLQED